MTVGEKIKQLRIKSGMTMEELGEKLGVQRSAVNKYETNAVDIKRSTLVALAKIFDVSPVEFFDWEDTPLSVDEHHMISAYRKLNRSGKGQAITRVEELGYIPAYVKDTKSDLTG